MVRIHPDPPGKAIAQVAAKGAVAQLGERLLCKQEVVGSIPSSSTISRHHQLASPVGWASGAAFNSGLLPGAQS